MAGKGSRARLRSEKFRGLYQDGDGFGSGLDYAWEGENFDCQGGGLAPFTGGEMLPGSVDAPIGTLAGLYRRYHCPQGEDALLLVAAAGTKLYARAANEDTWQEIASGLASDRFDFVSYEVNGYYLKDGVRRARAAEGAVWVDADAPIDVLLITNSRDGMYCVYGDTRQAAPVTIQPAGGAEVRFGVLARHAERIWGSGIEGDPDKLMYSAPYDPFDWDADPENPEDGAGDILQPSWDGDSFVALRPMGAQLLAVKKRRVWRILGADPSQYVMKEQYGGGAICENSLVVYGSEAFMLSREGLIRYDGAAAEPFGNDRVRRVLGRIRWDAAQNACAAMRGEVYCLALPLDNSAANNAILEYNTRTGAFCLRAGVGVRSFLETEGDLLYTGQTQGRVYRLSGGATLPLRWVSPWLDLDSPGCVKRRFEIRLCADRSAIVTVCVRTEKGVWSQDMNLVAGRPARLALQGRGRRFRLELRSAAGQAYALMGGLQAECDLDWD